MQDNTSIQNPRNNTDQPLEVKDCLLDNIERISYSDALALQHDLHDRCAAGEIPGVLLLLEHNPVITMGVKTSSRGNVLVSAESLKAQGVELVETDRGGDVTYHGPGQLVGYPIVRLREFGGDLHGYLRSLEQCVIDTIAQFGLKGERNGLAGVWVGDKKICSIGVAVRKWVTYHGFALNVDPNLSHFQLINPCGLPSEKITSMAKLLGSAPSMQEVREACARSFAAVFGVNMTPRGEPR
ncbi:MAG: lipoyl(octanoyl) transferase LipB [Armatimonadota bacterium]|nr:lipoyl(octanoyl) transferase LipB [bacterium]